jgi:4-hydroxybenzoate polyprenyltransferase
MARRFDLVAYLKLFRFPLVFTAIADGVAGLLLGFYYRASWTDLGLIAASSAGLYFFGMAQNDIADREKDKGSAPGRVIPSGRLSLRAAGWAAGLSLLGSLSANLAIGWRHLVQRLVLWSLVVVAICAYNLFLKLPPVMGLARAFNVLMGLSVGVPFLNPAVRTWAIALVGAPAFLYVSCLTYVSTMEDAEIDRTKLAVAVGGMAVGALLAAHLEPLILVVDAVSAATGGALAMVQSMAHWRGLLFATPLVGWLAWRAWKTRDKKGVMLLVRDGVAGIILLDAALISSDRGTPFGLMLAALLAPAAISVALFKRLA